MFFIATIVLEGIMKIAGREGREARGRHWSHDAAEGDEHAPQGEGAQVGAGPGCRTKHSLRLVNVRILPTD